MDDLQPLSAEILRSALSRFKTGVFGKNLHYHARTGSTNDLARDLVTQGAAEGTVVIADEQTAGRGRLGRQWIAPPYSSLTFTTLFRPALPAEFAFKLVMVCGLAIADSCEKIAPVRVEMKWPNDLQIGGKKFVGILPESSLTGDRLDWIIVGTGVNVNQVFDPADPLYASATSLRMVSGAVANRARLFALIMRNLQRWYARLADEHLLNAWRQRCVTLGQRVRVEAPQGIVTGEALDIGSRGALHLRDDSGNIHFIHASEASILRD